MNDQSNYCQSPQQLSFAQLNNPHGVICDFYYFIDLPRIRKFIDWWMVALYREQRWIGKSPADFLYFYDQLINLIEAAHVISALNNDKRVGIINLENNVESELMNPSLYCLTCHTDDAWDYFPRSLSRKEFIDPYKAIDKFFRKYNLDNWKSLLYNILHIALSSDKLDAQGEVVNVHYIKKQLDKLTDACHLIYVRELSEKMHHAINESDVKNEE